MPPSILQDIFHKFWMRKPTRKAHHQARSTETTEPLDVSPSENGRGNSQIPYREDISDLQDAESAKPSAVSQFRHRFTGWRCGALIFAICTSIVFCINLIVTIWGWASYNSNSGNLKEGECRDIKNLNSGLHIVINIFSTVLLSGSNYCMQCLSAPTRKDVDQAHAKGKWLDIGIPSFRNLRHISLKRVVLWSLLGTSSLPLHLLYNSVIYFILPSNSYSVYLVNQAFLDDTQCRNCSKNSDIDHLWTKSQHSGMLDKLDSSKCLYEYGATIQSHRDNLLLITSDNPIPVTTNGSTFYYEGVANGTSTWINNVNVYTSYRFSAVHALFPSGTGVSDHWVFSGTIKNGTEDLDLDEFIRASDMWRVGSTKRQPYEDRMLYQWPVRYCLSEKAVPHCKLCLNLVVAIIVTSLNFLKATIIFYMVYSTSEDPLMTLGDAIVSFIEKRDATTEKLPLLSLRGCKKGYSANAKIWNNVRYQWRHATNKARLMVTLIMFVVSLATVIAFLLWGTRRMIRSGRIVKSADILHLGFGAVDPTSLIDYNRFPTDVAKLALIANLPQVILSILYFSYNSLFTAMLMGFEWMSYAHKRKGLRVSSKPRGYQRSTYFLQLPYRFGIPLISLSIALHWLVSQTIFVVAIDVKDIIDVRKRTCGFSPVAMIAVILLGGVMTIAVIGFGFLPYKRGMPLAGSSSMAISSACHPRKPHESDETPISEQKLRWGVETSADGVRRCAFSSRDVGPLVKGESYN